MEYQPIFKGCIAVDYADGEYFPRRFTKEALAFYNAFDNDMYYIRALNSSGVTLEFSTDAQEVAFCFRGDYFSRPWVCFDVYEDGVFMQTIQYEEHTREGRFSYKRRLSAKSTLVIYVPATMALWFSGFELGAWEPVPDKKRRYLAIGDSITQGMDARCPSITYTNIIKRHLNAQIINQGVGGFIFDARSLEPHQPFEPDLISVAYGTNDIATIDETPLIVTAIEEYLEKLFSIYPNVSVNIITPIWRLAYEEQARFREKLHSINCAIAHAASKHQQAHMIDGMGLIPHSLDYLHDSLHPNELGFCLLGINLLKQLRL